MQRHFTALLVASLLLAATATAGIAVSQTGDADTVAIDTEHGLDTDPAISDYHAHGHATGDVEGLNATLGIGEDRSDVGIEDEFLPTNIRNNFLRIQYNEDFSRTLRIHIPANYQTPYTQSGVQSVTTDHAAEFSAVRGGEYLEIVIHVSGPADIVLPLQVDSSTSYKGVRYIDTRVKALTGASVMGSGDEWTYIDQDELSADAAYKLEGDPENIAVQFDSEKADPSETWLNAPEGEASDVGVYWFTREENGNKTAYVVATEEDPPNVRYKAEASNGDRFMGDVRDALKNFERIGDLFGSGGGDDGGDGS